MDRLVKVGIQQKNSRKTSSSSSSRRASDGAAAASPCTGTPAGGSGVGGGTGSLTVLPFGMQRLLAAA